MWRSSHATHHLLGIDIGTQGTKAVLFDRQGRALASAFRKSRLHQPAAGVVEEDPEYQFKTVCQCIKSCVTEAGIDRDADRGDWHRRTDGRDSRDRRGRQASRLTIPGWTRAVADYISEMRATGR